MMLSCNLQRFCAKVTIFYKIKNYINYIIFMKPLKKKKERNHAKC